MSRFTADGTALQDGPILVTGAAGFVGRHLTASLGMGPGDFACDATEEFEAPPGVFRLAWRLPGPPPAALGPVRTIIHLAAVSSVAGSMRNAAGVYEVNVAGTVSVLEYACGACRSPRILLASSSDVYGPAGSSIGEDREPAPVSPYGGSKAAAETAALQFARHPGLDLVIARPFPHFGPWQSPSFAIPSFCIRVAGAARRGEASVTAGNLSAVRDYTDVSDVVAAYGILLSRGASGGIFNICSGEGRSMQSILDFLIGRSGARLSVKVDESLLRPSDIAVQVGDPSKVEALGWRRRTSVEDGLAALLDWWRERI